MELSHRFSVPTSVEQTWAHFADLGAVAECFPGAQLASVEEDSFHGSVKVKLGPTALLYNGSGTFVERDDAAHRFVIEAKGKDKRGNGTAGALVTLAMAAAGSGPDVDVTTDLTITGKPAQFGRGVMQDVSDKLLGQFVTCLETRLGAESVEAVPAAEAPPAAAVDAATAAPSTPRSTSPSIEPSDQAIDLGTTVLPVVARAYWKQALVSVAVLAVVVWLVRRLL
jgi:carbon monoxide dehydrogenase subunit G